MITSSVMSHLAANFAVTTIEPFMMEANAVLTQLGRMKQRALRTWSLVDFLGVIVAAKGTPIFPRLIWKKKSPISRNNKWKATAVERMESRRSRT